MNTHVTPEIREIIEAVHYRPAISVILPFEPKMGQKAALSYSLKTVTDRVEQELIANYPEEIVSLSMHKLKTVIKNLNFDTHKKSIAIYVSPVFEKVIYLDIPVEEKIIIDESFEIRDLVYNKKKMQDYLILLLSSNEIQLYHGSTNMLAKIVSATPESFHAFENDVPQRVANFSDMAERKEILMNKFLHHVDHSLDHILKAYQLPIFVLGTERISGHFKSLTKHKAAIVEYIHGNYEEASLSQLQELLKPYLDNWEKVRQRKLMNEMDEAAGNKKLVYGMKAVWQEVMNQKGRLLLVEKDYRYTAEHGSREDIIYKADEAYNNFSHIKDAVDDVIEKILEKGGDVEFVDENALQDYQHIALIKYY